MNWGRIMKTDQRRGTAAALAVFSLIVLVVLAAFSVELGMFMAEQAEMQRASDAAAMAACWEYYSHLGMQESENDARTYSRQVAKQLVMENLIGGEEIEIGLNSTNDIDGDIVFGTYDEFGSPGGNLVPVTNGLANAVKVTIARTTEGHGEVDFSLARILGVFSKPLTTESTAAVASNISGFKTPANNEKLNIMPFAVKLSAWNDLMAGQGDDNWIYNPETGAVTQGSDGILELNIYPHATGSSGNSGTVDIGSNSNSTNDIKRQILEGISSDDLGYHGGKLELDANGELVLNGDTGVSAGIKSQLASIIGDPKIILVYSQVTGNGNNANFTIVKFVGVRVVEVDFSGSKNKKKKLIIQPAYVSSPWVLTSSIQTDVSDYVYSPVVLVK